MKEHEQVLWQRYIDARNELVVYYLPLISYWVKKIAGKAYWTNKEDLSQEAVKGIIEAIGKFNLNRQVEFNTFARPYIYRAILESSELTRDLMRTQYENYCKVQKANDVLMKRLERKPTIEEIANEAKLTIKQVDRAIDAFSIAFAAELPDFIVEKPTDVVEQQDAKILIEQMLAHLTQDKVTILTDYYITGLSDDEIGRKLNKQPDTVKKARLRALKQLSKLLKAQPSQEDLTTRKR